MSFALILYIETPSFPSEKDLHGLTIATLFATTDWVIDNITLTIEISLTFKNITLVIENKCLNIDNLAFAILLATIDYVIDKITLAIEIISLAFGNITLAIEKRTLAIDNITLNYR